MKTSNHQWIAIAITMVFVLIFYFGCDTTDKNIRQAEKSRSASLEVTSIENIKQAAFDSLNPASKAYYDGLQIQLSESIDDSMRIDRLKEISGFWYQNQEYAISGDVAKEIAKFYNSAQAWSIAGTTFAAGIKNGKSDKIRQFNQGQAVQAFETAISLEPTNVDHQVNLAICYAELPPADNPMQGILMLLDLDKKNPESVPVLFQLARFGMQTGQFDKAIGRLEKAILIEPNNSKLSCLLSDAYGEVGNIEKQQLHRNRCENK